MRLTRRSVLAGLAGAGLTRASQAADAPIHLSLPLPGGAGSVWKPIIDKLPGDPLASLNVQWVGGTPGQVELQLLSGAVDVAAFGPLGVAAARARGSDIVIFGPALNNHGHWLVHPDSPYRHPKDLVGKRIASQPEASETFLQARMAAALIGIDLKQDMQIIFGPPTANQALFERGDVDGVIALESMATRLVGRGARELISVADMWREGTGEEALPFLAGQGARRAWVEADPDRAKRVAGLVWAANRQIRADPGLLATLHRDLGVTDAETAAIGLLPERMAKVYATAWDDALFASMDRQIEVAARLGLIPGKPARPVYELVA